MSLWGVFKTAVYRAQDERAQDVRRTRALERIAGALEFYAENGPPQPTYYAPPYYPPPHEEPRK